MSTPIRVKDETADLIRKKAKQLKCTQSEAIAEAFRIAHLHNFSEISTMQDFKIHMDKRINQMIGFTKTQDVQLHKIVSLVEGRLIPQKKVIETPLKEILIDLRKYGLDNIEFIFREVYKIQGIDMSEYYKTMEGDKKHFRIALKTLLNRYYDYQMKKK